MPTLPAALLPFIVEFQPLFSKSVWENAQTLLAGAILATGKRTVIACLGVMGKSADEHFQNYHRVLNRSRWSALQASRLLLRLLLAAFAPTGALVCGLDDTIERRRGAKITAKGIYRDPVSSSHAHFVKASGLRWRELYVACQGAVGGRGLGAAVSDRALPLRALLPGQAASASKADRARLASNRAAGAVAARPHPGLCRR